MSDRFVYVTYIRTTPETLWEHLTKPEFIRVYWHDISAESDWKPGSSWKLIYPDGRVTDTGEIIEAHPPRRLIIKWRNEFRPELKAEGYSRATFLIEPAHETVKLTVTHEIDRAGSKFIEAVSQGWPSVLSSLKSLLETGKPLPRQKAA
ncbi:MAG TPA: SRPBCC family protein [Stellaceae bacterium]|nr:SRPBCC family protein [Stellaceae bacterium]